MECGKHALAYIACAIAKEDEAIVWSYVSIALRHQIYPIESLFEDPNDACTQYRIYTGSMPD